MFKSFYRFSCFVPQLRYKFCFNSAYLRFISGSTGDSSLLKRFPELAAEWHPTKNGTLTPDKVTYSSTKVVWWKCKQGHEWKSSIFSRGNHALPGTLTPHQCPYCSHKKASPDYNLQVISPEIAAEWHPTKNGDLKPTDVLPRSNKKVWWQCSRSQMHEWQTSPHNRINKSGSITKCPFCSNRQVSATNVFTKNRDLMEEWDYEKNIVKPDELQEGSSQIVWWKCKNNPEHRWCTQLRNRARYHDRCPFCSGKRKLFEKEKKELKDNKNTNKDNLNTLDYLSWYSKCYYECKDIKNREHVVFCSPYQLDNINVCPYCRCEKKGFSKIEPTVETDIHKALRETIKNISKLLV